MALLYVAAGSMHFAHPQVYEHIMPSYLPAPHQLVLFSGAAEIAGGIGLLVPKVRQAAAWGLVCLLVAVFPANLWMAQHPELAPYVAQWVLWLRLPLQLPLIWWAYSYTKKND